MTDLDDLAVKYKNDRTPARKHHHTAFYYEEFKNRRLSVKKVLEIGIGGSDDNFNIEPDYIIGSGLFMWRDFFPNAMIYGVDVLPSSIFQAERIQTFLCDQRDKKGMTEIVKQIGSDIDLVIDDGSHRSRHQVATCKLIVPLLKKGAIYVIEDVVYPSIMTLLTEFDCQQVIPHRRKHHDDRLIVVRV